MRGQAKISESKPRSRLLSREQFRNAVFSRDGGLCVVCKAEAKDAHHLLERRLWPDGGYYLENGVSLCSEHHLQAEQTILSVDALRQAAGIKETVLPPGLSEDEQYDKWGNPVLSSGMRSRGPLFYQEPVQKALAAGEMLDLFSPYVKYPRTPHLPWSPGFDPQDQVLGDAEHFEGQEVIASEKLDGESATFYKDYIHARSLESTYHATRTMVRAIQAKVGHQLPEGWRIVGENIQGEHAIKYEDCPAFFVISIWDQENNCLSWEETKEYAEMLELPCVPVLYQGAYNKEKIHDSWDPQGPSYASRSEGYVVRKASSFSYADFQTSIAKYVRAGHVAGSEHWMRQGQARHNKVYLP
jgi:hypothetical protein